MKFDESFQSFKKELEDCLFKNAKSKGYANDNGGRDFFDSVDNECPGHAAGEIRYKIKRWQAKKNPEDLVKIAAWAFLIWDQFCRREGIAPNIPKAVMVEYNIGAFHETQCTHAENCIGECRCTCVSCLEQRSQ